MGFSRLFRSRWAAVLWAAGICWTAISFAGGDDTRSIDAAKAPSNDAAASAALLAEDDD